MARNEEKAQAMLNRFVTAKKDANREDKSQRPYLSTECSSVPDCEMYRNQIIKEISKKVSLIQNEGLEEHRVRDLNDSINKLMREKGHWERQIKSLGGPDYFKLAPKLLDEDAEEVVPGKGYKYYGAAKRLPGVRDLFKKAVPEKVKRTRHEIFKTINADYYGYRDDDDGVLVKLEGEAEASLLQAKVAKWEEGRAARQELGTEEAAEEETAQFVAHVEVPDQAAVQQAILARRKRELLASFAAGKEQEDAIEHAGAAPPPRSRPAPPAPAPAPGPAPAVLLGSGLHTRHPRAPDHSSSDASTPHARLGRPG
jgi:pre-mRNA-splicing factor ISY1